MNKKIGSAYSPNTQLNGTFTYLSQLYPNDTFSILSFVIMHRRRV